MTNCVISDNTAPLGGAGGFYNGAFNLIYCVAANNESYEDNSKRGLLLYPYTNVNIENSIFWHESPNEGKEIYLSDLDLEELRRDADMQITAVISYSNIKGGESGVYVGAGNILDWQSGNISSDPGFAFQDDYHIMAGSSCIDAGTNNLFYGVSQEDIDGNIRPLDGNGDMFAVADMGAYEYVADAPTIALASDFFTFKCREYDTSWVNQVLALRNSGGGELSWQIDEKCPWLDVDVSLGVSTGSINEVRLNVNPANLTVGEYKCNLTIKDDNAVNNPRDVFILLDVRNGLLHVPGQYDTIQQAVNAAEEGEVVLVANGVYRGNGNRDLEITKAITLKSENGPDACIIDCQGSIDNPHRAFFINMPDRGRDAKLVLEGFSIVNGYVNDNLMAPILPFLGGGFLSHNESSVIIRDCIIKDCYAAWCGGGIYMEGNYRAKYKSYITNCIVTHNSADGINDVGGGGIFVPGSVDIRNSIINGNSSKKPGGGVYIDTPFSGAGIELLNCTVVDNVSRSSGGGIYFSSSARYTDEVRLRNSIVRDNQAGTISNPGRGQQISIETGEYGFLYTPELKVSYSNIQGGETGVFVSPNSILNWQAGNIDIVPGFDSDYFLAPGSPCIDQGDPSQAIPEPARNRLLAHWKLDEDTGPNVSDSSGNDYVSTLYGDQIWRPCGGQIEGGLYFDGDGDFISGDNICPEIAEKYVTVSAWVKPDSITTQQSIFAFNTAAGDCKLMLGRPDDSFNLYLRVGKKWIDTSTPIFDGNWHFIAFVLYDVLFGHRIYVYVDGERVYNYGNSGVNIAADDRFSIGQAYDKIPGNYFKGFIDDVRVYKAPLSHFAVNFLYTAGAEVPANEEDIDGQPRIAGARVDIGAYEHQVQRFTLSVNVIGNGFATPSMGVYGAGKIVDLIAIPDTYFRIKAWRGADDDSSTNFFNSVTMDADKTVTVVFEEIPEYSLSTMVVGQGEISPSGGHYRQNSVVKLTAKPVADWRLKSWRGTDNDSSVEAVNTVTIDADKTVTAEFEEIPQYTLLVTAIGQGEFSPSNGLYYQDAVVKLSAHPALGWRIKSWKGADDESSTDPNNTVTIDADKTVTVVFEKIRYQLTVEVWGGNGQVIPVSDLYEYGTVVDLTAWPDDCYRVKSWKGTDNDTSSEPNNTVTMNSEKLVTVEFEPIAYELRLDVIGGYGTVTADPSGGVYAYKTRIILTAHPEADYRIKHWSGTSNDSSQEYTNSVIMNSDRIVTVEFEPVPVTLTTEVTGGHGRLTPSGGDYDIHSSVKLKAIPDPYYRVKKWSGTQDDSSRKGANKVLLDSDKIVTVEFESAFTIKVNKMKVKADTRKPGQGTIGDSFEISGIFDATPEMVEGSEQVFIKLTNTKEMIFSGQVPFVKNKFNKQNKYSYSSKRGDINSFDFNLKKKTFSVSAKKVDLTGLSSPLIFELQIGDSYGAAVVAEEYPEYLALGGTKPQVEFKDVINGHDPIPMRLMQSYADALRVDKVKLRHNKKKDIDTLVVAGALAVLAPETWNDLIKKGLTVIWGTNDYEETVEALKFLPVGGKYLYKKRKNESGTIATVQFDKNKCTFKITIQNASIASRSGPVVFGLKFGSFEQTYIYTLDH